MKFIEANALFGRHDPIFSFTEETTSIYNKKDLNKNHVLILHGGADISPSLYNKPLAPKGNGSKRPSLRDRDEWEILDHATKLGIPIIGICRGAQMLCAFDGGELVQHIEGHTHGQHFIKIKETSEKILSNSCHHQMMVSKKWNKILAVSSEDTYGYDENDIRIHIPEVPEIVYFPRLNAIGIQGHPEWQSQNSPFVQVCSKLINQYLLKD